MGNDQDRSLNLIPHLFENADQAVETPEVNTCLRLIKDGKLCSSCRDHGDLNTLQFSSGKTVIDGGNITTGYLSADRIKGGTIDATTINVTNLNANNITSGSFGSDRIANGAITSTKYGRGSIGSDAIGTNAVINRHIQSGSIYPSTCNDTINGYFADVIYTQKVYAGTATAEYMRATYLYGDEFSIGNYQEGALVGHTRVKLLDKDQATQVVGV